MGRSAEQPTAQLADHGEGTDMQEEAMRAAHLTEVTARPYADCLEALRRCDGCVHTTALELLESSGPPNGTHKPLSVRSDEEISDNAASSERTPGQMCLAH